MQGQRGREASGCHLAFGRSGPWSAKKTERRLIFQKNRIRHDGDVLLRRHSFISYVMSRCTRRRRKTSLLWQEPTPFLLLDQGGV